MAVKTARRIRPRPYVRVLRARIVLTSGVAIGAHYPGASLSTRYVAELARYLVSELLDIPPVSMIAYDRGPRNVAFGRQLAIHLTHIVAGRRHEEVAAAFRRNRSTASHHFEVLENLRDVEDFDHFLTGLENKYAHMLRAAENSPAQAWGQALDAMAKAVHQGRLDPDAHYDAKYVIATFKKPATCE